MQKFVKFALVGVLNTAVNYISFCGLIFVGLHYMLSSSGAWLIAVTNSFFCNKAWTFPSKENLGKIAYIAYLGANLFSLLLTLLILFLCVQAGLSKYIAQALAILIVTPINFLLRKKILQK